jgi:hypothetical protein
MDIRRMVIGVVTATFTAGALAAGAATAPNPIVHDMVNQAGPNPIVHDMVNGAAGPSQIVHDM